MSLTETQIKLLKPKNKLYKKYDAKGLYLEVSPNDKKGWRFKYRFDNKEKRLSLGSYPKVTLSLARWYRDLAQGYLAKGVDPTTMSSLWKQKASCTKHLIDIEKVIKILPDAEREHICGFFKKYNELLEKKHVEQSLIKSLLSSPPKKWKSYFEETKNEEKQPSKQDVIRIIYQFDRVLRDIARPRELFSIEFFSTFILAHLDAIKDYSALRIGIKKQKEYVNEFNNQYRKLMQLRLHLDRAGIRIPSLINTCLITGLDYFESYNFLEDDVSKAALSTRQACPKTEFLRGLLKILENKSIPITKDIMGCSYILSKLLLKSIGIDLSKQDFWKTVGKKLT